MKMANKSVNKELSFMNLRNKSINHRRSFLAIALVLFFLSAKLVFAENNPSSTSSDSAKTNTEENENSTITNIKKVIQEKKAELGTAGANIRSERAYLAKVLRVSEETLTVSNYAGSKIIPIDEDVAIQKNDKDAKVTDIAVDNWVSVYGEMQNDNLKIKKIEIYEKDFSPKNKVIALGSISGIGKDDMKVNPRNGEKELSFSFSKQTNFQNYQGEEAKLSDFYKDLQCLVVAFADKNGNYVVSTIRALSAFEK